MIAKRLIDEWGKAKLAKTLTEGNIPKFIVAASMDCFGDGVWVECSNNCGKMIVVRSWLMPIVEKHKIPVICLSCVHKIDPEEFHAQLKDDLEKILKEADK